jgi:hypothetical protein
MLIIFTSIVGIGQFLFSMGFSLLSIHMMVAGRVIMGFGGQSIVITATSLIAEYFKQDYLSLSIVRNLNYDIIS